MSNSQPREVVDRGSCWDPSYTSLRLMEISQNLIKYLLEDALLIIQ